MPDTQPTSVGTGKVRIENDFIRLTFDERTGLLTHLLDLEGDVAHLAPPAAPAGIWKLTFRAGTEERFLEPPGLGGKIAFERGVDAAGRPELTIAWRGLTFQNLKDAVDVVVRVALASDSAQTEWRISVANRSERYGLWEVAFPWLGGWPAVGIYDLAVGRANWGQLYRKLEECQEGAYSSGGWPMPFFLLLTGDRGLYVAAHDARQFHKKFSVHPGKQTAVLLPVPYAGLPGTGLEDLYPVVIRPYRGGWREGAKIYRAWALKQPWAAKGPLSGRQDVPAALKEIGLWFLCAYPGPEKSEEWTSEILQAAGYYGVPVGVHIYQWHEIAFDNHYPEYFPAKRGVVEAVRRLTAAGILAMPYINARLWDRRTDSFKQAQSACTKDPLGVPPLELYGAHCGQLIPMCPWTKFWQDKVLELCRKLAEEMGVNAIYLDQVSAAAPVPCFDRSHGHPVGGGDYWHQGYRQMLERIRKMLAQPGKSVALTSEFNAEANMDGIDAFLIWVSREDNEIPLITAVYGGYSLYFGSPHPTNCGLMSFVMVQARDFIWGAQLGWMAPAMPEPFKEYLRTLVRLRVQARKFLTYGELVGELTPVVEPAGAGDPASLLANPVSVPSVSAVWPFWGQPKLGTLPAVLSSIWRAEDGELGLFIANVSEEPRAFHFAFDPAAYGVKGAELIYTPITPAGLGEPVRASGGVQARSENLPPFGVAVYAVRPA
jgi:hypothetical protein